MRRFLLRVGRGLVRVGRRIVATEPVRLVAAAEAAAAIVLTFTDVIDPATLGKVIAAIVPTHELIRSLVSPARAVSEGE